MLFNDEVEVGKPGQSKGKQESAGLELNNRKESEPVGSSVDSIACREPMDCVIGDAGGESRNNGIIGMGAAEGASVS